MRATHALYVDIVRPALLASLRALPDSPERFDTGIAPIVRAGWPAWEEFFFFATYHGILGPIDVELARRTDLPQSVRDASQRRRALEQLWHGYLARGLLDAVRMLADSGIETCALKGSVLAARLYPDPAARHCLDIDLLVRRDDLERALHSFSTAGYIAERGVAAAYALNYGHHVTLVRPATPVIELHFRPYSGFGVQLPTDEILQRAHSFPLSDALSVRVLSPEDELIYLAAHAAGHSFIRLVWLYDLKLFLRAYPALDWDVVATRAEVFGLARVVGYSLALLERWLDVAIPAVPSRLRGRGLRQWLADRLLTEASTPQDKSPRDNLGGLLFTSMLCDTVRSGAWLVQHHILRMTRRRLHRLAPLSLPEHWSA